MKYNKILGSLNKINNNTFVGTISGNVTVIVVSLFGRINIKTLRYYGDGQEK